MINRVVNGGSEFNGLKMGERVILKMVIDFESIDVPVRIIGFDREHWGNYNTIVEVDKKYGYSIKGVLKTFEHSYIRNLELLSSVTDDVYIVWTSKACLRKVEPEEINNNKLDYPQTLTPQQKLVLDYIDYIANNPTVYLSDNIRFKGFTISNPIHKHENIKTIKGTVGNENYFDNALNAALKSNKGHNKEKIEENDRCVLSAIEEATHFKPSSHYEFGNGLNCMTFIEEAIKDLKGIEAFYVANAIKYLFRTTKKNGDDDLKKAHNYLTLLLKKRGLM